MFFPHIHVPMYIYIIPTHLEDFNLSLVHVCTLFKTICLTKHSQTEFLLTLPSLVLGDARVLSFIQFGNIHYSHFWAIFIKTVLLFISEFYSVPVDNIQVLNTEASQYKHHSLTLFVVLFRKYVVVLKSCWEQSEKG